MKVVESFPHQVEHVEHAWIAMPDGTRLGARMWIPASARQEPVPAILEYLPYRKRDQTRQRDDTNGPYLAGHGHAFVRVDIRGFGDSEGYVTDQYSEAELSDGVEVIRWLAEQPWCSGRVGMIGKSWGGFNALQIAARRPSALGAIVTVCSTDDTYVDNMHYKGGCLLGDNLSEATTMFAYQSAPPDPAVVGGGWRAQWMERLELCHPWLTQWLEHPWRDAYWKPSSVCEDYGAIQCPVMTVGGWADGFTNAVFRLVERLDVPRRALIGPWSHRYPHVGVPGPAIGFLQEVIRWFDRWLKGVESGVEAEPVLRVWMQDSVAPQFSAYSERPGRWVAERSWPAPRIEMRRFPFAERRLRLEDVPSEGAPPASMLSPLSVGLYAGKWCSSAVLPDLPGDQREEDGGSLVFESKPLPEPLEILGTPRVELEVSADRPTAMVAVRLSDVFPDGRAARVTYGLLNLTHRGGHAKPAPLIPGERVRVTVPLDGLAQRFPAGHRLRVSVSSSYWPLAWPSPEPTTITLYPDHCALWLPERPPGPDDDGLRAFEPPEGAPPSVEAFTEPGERTWRVIRDLQDDSATLEVRRHDGRLRYESTGLELEKRTLELYKSKAGDFRSIEGETHTLRGFTRGEWNAKAVTHTVLTASAARFHLHASLDAYEGRERVFSRTWTRDLDRQLV